MTFDPEPFAGYDPMREIRQRINQTNSEAGLPAVLDWSPEDAESQLLAHSQFKQTRSHDMRRWAAAIVDEHLRWRDPHDDLPSGPCVLFAFDTRIPFSLAEHRVKDLVAKYLSDRYTSCDVQAHALCQNDDATHVLTVGYGEWVCLGKCCDTCKAFFYDPDEKRWASINFPPNAYPLSDRHAAT